MNDTPPPVFISKSKIQFESNPKMNLHKNCFSWLYLKSFTFVVLQLL